MRTLLLVVLVFGIPAVAIANAQQVRFIGIHPVAKSEGSGMCYIEGPHVHIYDADKLQYREHEGHNHFVGDPVAYGYNGPKHAYKGHHPIQVHVTVGAPDPQVEYCYIDGPHYHPFPAPPGPDFQISGGAHFYVGAPPPVYVEARPAYIGINAIYTPIVYARPSIVVAAPVGWIHARPGFAIGVGVGIVGPGVVVGAPGVVVRGPQIRAGVQVIVPPPPSVRVDIGIGVGVGGGGRAKVKRKRGWR